MKYVFHPDALAEYAEAVKYYATQNSQIAQAFINSIDPIVFDFCELACHRIGDRLQQQAQSFRNLRMAELNPTTQQ